MIASWCSVADKQHMSDALNLVRSVFFFKSKYYIFALARKAHIAEFR